jgi:hypothetical protein
MRVSLRPLIWAAVRQLASDDANITAPQVRSLMTDTPTGVLHRIRDYLRALTAGGYLVKLTPDDAPDEAAYRLERDAGYEAPRVRADGTEIPRPGRERMWSVMRVLKDWTALDLAVHSSLDDQTVAESEADQYCKTLCRAGYLQRVQPGRWRLVGSRWRGPKPPMVRRDRSIFDPNTKTIYDPRGQEVVP